MHPLHASVATFIPLDLQGHDLKGAPRSLLHIYDHDENVRVIPRFNSQPWFVWISLFYRICLKALDQQNSRTPSFSKNRQMSSQTPPREAHRTRAGGTKGSRQHLFCANETFSKKKTKTGSVTQNVQLLPSGFPFCSPTNIFPIN